MGQQAWQLIPDILLHGNAFYLFLRVPNAFPSPEKVVGLDLPTEVEALASPSPCL